MRRQPGPPFSSQEEWERYRKELESRRGTPTGGEQGRQRYGRGEERAEQQYQSQRYPGGQEFAGGYSTSGGHAASRDRPYSGHVRYSPEREAEERGFRQQEGFQPRREGWSEEAGRYGREEYGRGGYEEQARYGPAEGPWGEEQGPGHYGREDYGEGWEGPAGFAEQAYEQGGQRRGFGHGEFGHPRHRTSWGEVGRSSVYGQPYGEPPSAYGGAYGGDIARYRRGPKGYVRSDERIREFICERLTEHHRLDVSDVSVDVTDGHVILDGTVPERRMKHAIEDVADDCWGVRDVENRIKVALREESGGQQMTSETAIGAGAPMSGGASMGAGDPMTSSQPGGAAGSASQAGESKGRSKKEERS